VDRNPTTSSMATICVIRNRLVIFFILLNLGLALGGSVYEQMINRRLHGSMT
jgi:hypothetical protein